MTSKNNKNRSNRIYKNGLMYDSGDSKMVVSIDPYGVGTTKYNTKNDNYEALRHVDKNRL